MKQIITKEHEKIIDYHDRQKSIENIRDILDEDLDNDSVEGLKNKLNRIASEIIEFTM